MCLGALRGEHSLKVARSARAVQRLSLTHDERIALFQEWVLPLLIFPARAYFPTDSVVAKLANVYKVALRLNSWGLTLPILAHTPAQGGNNLPQPRTFLMWQHTTAFVKFLHEPNAVPSLSRAHMRAWSASHGVNTIPRPCPGCNSA